MFPGRRNAISGWVEASRFALLLIFMMNGQALATGFSEMAAEIERITHRSPEGLIIETSTDGTRSVDLQGRYGNVTLLQVGDDNIPLAYCVDDLRQADIFFGLNLKTGKALAPEARQEHEALIETARRHGMNTAEYLFYTDLIESTRTASQLAGPQAGAGAVFEFTYTDDPDEGFFSTSAALLPAPGNNGANLGLQRQVVLSAAAEIWSSVLDTPVPITVTASFDPLFCDAPRATGGYAQATGLHGLVIDPDPLTWYPRALANKIRGRDLSESSFDMLTAYNSNIDNNCLGSGATFYYGLDNQAPTGTFNLFMIALHELGHGLGFATYTDATNGEYFIGAPDIWARFLFDATQNRTWVEMDASQRAQSAVNTNNVYWDGENVRQASGFLGSNGRDPATGRVQMYTPSPIQEGSSVSHFNTAASPDLLMEPILTAGLPTTLDLTRQQMRDIGWFRDDDANNEPDSISNVLPSGGHVQTGTSQTVTWDNSSGFDRNVTIELSTDGGASFTHTLATNVSNSGSRQVSIPFVDTTQGRFRVREHDYLEPAGVSAANILINSNSPPTFTPGPPIERQQGAPAGPEPAVLGTVSDVETPQSLSVSRIDGGTATGIIVSSIDVAENGTAFALVFSANCTATTGTVRFEVSDGQLTDSGDVQVNVTPNPPPQLGTYTDAIVKIGEAPQFVPTTPPDDNASVASFVVGIQPNSFTGTLLPEPSTGIITILNAGPEGDYMITATVTDNCGAITEREVELRVLGDTIFVNGFEAGIQ
jgi:hypothetical protein